MKTFKVPDEVNPRMTLEATGFAGVARAHYNLLEPALLQAALARGEGDLGRGGAFLVSTGRHTGRSPKDKFVVREPSVEADIWWENNAPMAPDAFARLLADMREHIRGAELFVQDLYAGADPDFRLNVRVITELAWHGLFIRHLLRRPAREELASFEPGFTILNCPSFHADPARHGCRSETVIAISFEQKLVLIGGTAYAGENKKSVFTLLNYLLPERGVMPMHCSANHAQGDPDDVAVFFGLSGTGKTTLSADPARILIGDDEHGWSDAGTFNFEGGCYAKTINLSRQGRARDLRHHPPLRHRRREHGLGPGHPRARLRRRQPDRQHPLRLPARGDLQRLRHRPRRRAAQRRHAHLRRLRRAAAHRAADPGAGDVPLPLRLHLQGRRHRARRHRAAAHLLHLLRRPVHAAPPRGLRRHAARPHRPRRRHLLAGQHRLDRRRLRHRPAHAHRRHPRAPDRRARRLARPRRASARTRSSASRSPLDVPGVDAALLDPRGTWADPAAYDAQAAKLAAMFARTSPSTRTHVSDDVRAAAIRAA